MIKEFEADETKPNPYEVPRTGMCYCSPYSRPNSLPGVTENDVRLQFAQEEFGGVEMGDGGALNGRVTRSGFITEGLDIEEQQ